MLLDFGFDRDRSCLALKLSGNDLEEAVEILTDEAHSDLGSLYAEVQRREAERASAQNQ